MQKSRIGLGYDVHRLVPGRALVLGGVHIPHEKGLEGHSDADVLLHAICDALLGAAALGDIGQHFPNNDARFKDISSIRLLEQVKHLLSENGYAVVNVDSMLLLERPKIAPFIQEMRNRIASALGVRPDQVSVKATTAEGLGFVGREEGAAAHAIATIEKE